MEAIFLVKNKLKAVNNTEIMPACSKGMRGPKNKAIVGWNDGSGKL